MSYELAREFLLNLDEPDVTPQLIDKYCLGQTAFHPTALADIYQALLFSAQNNARKSSAIGKSIGGVDKLGLVLCDFDARAVLAKYPGSWEPLLADIQYQLKPTGEVRTQPKSHWPTYCRSILSAARFITQFASADDFYQWVGLFDGDDRSRAGLPLVIQQEVYGIGFALACDFLKELGYVNYAKPDVHIWDLFTGLGLSDGAASDYELLRAIVRVAKHAGQTPYAVDKLFWLIGSGTFYDDPQIGNNGSIGRHKDQFIAFALAKLRA